MELATQSQQTLALSTVCDENYVNQAIAMINSVEEHSSLNLQWFILALTDKAFDLLNKRRRTNWNVLSVPEIDQDFFKLRNARPWREFCWTAASVFLNYVTNSCNATYIGYVDADCFFFRDISEYIKDLGDASVLIIPHDFSPDREEWRYKSGEFNVGLILGKTDHNFKTCISKWREQVLEECVVDPVLGKCGDQTYLNDWPNDYKFVKVLDRRGSALGPWNVNNYSKINHRKLTTDGKPIYFYHFHGLVVCILPKLLLYLPAPGYFHSLKNLHFIYRHYVGALLLVSQTEDTELRTRSFKEFTLVSLKSRQFPRIRLIRR